MRKPKTAKHVREEILGKYFELKGYVGGGVSLYRGIPPLQKETCFGERDCLDILKARDDILDEIFHDYFEPLTGGMKYRDPAGNVYRNRQEALDSLENDMYNQGMSKRIKSSEAMSNG